MTPVSRSAIFAKIHKVLKKYYKPVPRPAERTVLEHLLFACVLEDARYEAAEDAFAALQHTFYDWNEVRVTSISELSEVMAALPEVMPLEVMMVEVTWAPPCTITPISPLPVPCPPVPVMVIAPAAEFTSVPESWMSTP